MTDSRGNILPLQQKHVAILLASFNGDKFIAEQLDSIRKQSHTNWSLWISDDGSSDATLAEIKRFASPNLQKRINIVQGPGRGFVANFLSLICNPEIDADYFAFCDQDDIWFENKLEVAVEALSAFASQPAAYFGRVCVVDETGRTVGASPLFTRKPSLENALVQSIGGGNTTVMNLAAHNILRLAGRDVPVASHDWWTYLAVTACGGTAIYDPMPFVKYRQHDSNVIGENSSISARLFRIHLLMKGRFSTWIEGNLVALKKLEAAMPEKNVATIAAFRALRQKWGPFTRIAGLYRLGLYRQTRFGNISLLMAALLGKW